MKRAGPWVDTGDVSTPLIRRAADEPYEIVGSITRTDDGRIFWLAGPTFPPGGGDPIGGQAGNLVAAMDSVDAELVTQGFWLEEPDQEEAAPCP